MLERLGHVLGWIGNILAILMLIWSAIMYFALRNDPANSHDPYFLPLFAGGLCVIAVAIFAVGRGLRYIFAGPSRSSKNEGVPTASDFWR
jgi:hypothetical protein